MKLFENLKTKISKKKRIWILVAIGVLGVAFIALSEFLPAKTDHVQEQQEQSDAVATEYCAQTEQRLAEVIAEVQGVGRVKVMLTLEGSDEKIYAVDEKIEEKSGGDTAQKNVQSEYVLIDGSRGDEGMILKTNTPKVKGVIVVCDGGGNADVSNQVTKAVGTALGIGANRISVLQMKSEEA